MTKNERLAYIRKACKQHNKQVKDDGEPLQADDFVTQLTESERYVQAD